MLHYRPNTFAQTFFFVSNYPLAAKRRTIHIRTSACYNAQHDAEILKSFTFSNFAM